jgi:hypothetical protein
MRIHRLIITTTMALLFANPAFAAAPQVAETIKFTYADLADMALAAPIAAGAEIRRASKLKGASAAGVRPGHARYYIEADVKTLIRGAQGLPARVSYLADVPTDTANRSPKLRKARILLLANTVAGRPGELRLIAPNAQLAWTPDNEARVRAILRAATDPAAPPRITGVGKAFYVPGSLPGESETQIFLTTADSRPISLAILRRPGEAPRWVVALGEMVDDSAAPPTRDSLLWYRLACFLPPALPDTSTADMNAEEAAAATTDYALVIEGLGRCERALSR